MDKRISALAVAIQMGATVHDLEEAELCYAPQFGSAKDAVNFAGMVGADVLDGDMPLAHWDGVKDAFLLDVRQPVELVVGSVPGATNIPLPELRSRLSELPRDREILVICRSAQRAYYATRVLLQNGFEARDLSGGTLARTAAFGSVNDEEASGVDRTDASTATIRTLRSQHHAYESNTGAASTRMRSRWLTFIAMSIAIVLASGAVAQAPAAPSGAAAPVSDEELAKLVGPIALYPDDLVAIILPASTNPLQLVQADRFLEKRKTDPKAPIDDKWDDPVKSLLNYPDVVKMMSADLDWTSALGEAVVADQGAVIDAVQAFRRKAQAAGSLKSDDKQVVKVEKEIVYIQPADPQVIYVPQYNPTTVVVQGAPPVYYPTPIRPTTTRTRPGRTGTGVIWGAAIGAAWSGNRHGRGNDANINVNRNTNINTPRVPAGDSRQGAAPP